MLKRKELLSAVFTLVFIAGTCASVDARGGGGGGGGRGGGGGWGGGGYGGRSDFGGGMRAGDYGHGFGDGFGRIDNGFGRDGDFGNRDFAGDRDSDDYGARTQADLDRTDADLDREADHLWNTPSTDQRQMATDGGFGRVADDQGFGARNFVQSGNRTYPYSGRDLAATGNLVRNNFGYRDAFSRNWWNNHPGLWYRPWFNDYGWGDGWGWSDWGDLSGFWGYDYDDTPVEYDYGNNITYQGDTVYYGNQPVETDEQYYDGAEALAQSGYSTGAIGQVAEKQDNNSSYWKPMGVFSLVQGGQKDSTTLFQLAVSKNYAIRGNYYNTLTNATKTVSGAVDKKTMRAAWTVDGAQDVVYDTGVANLMKAESPVLIHFAKNKTEQWELVRLQKPTQQPESKTAKT